MRFRNIQSVGQALPCLCFKHCGVAVLYLADALGVDAGLLGHSPLTHTEG